MLTEVQFSWVWFHSLIHTFPWLEARLQLRTAFRTTDVRYCRLSIFKRLLNCCLISTCYIIERDLNIQTYVRTALFKIYIFVRGSYFHYTAFQKKMFLFLCKIETVMSYRRSFHPPTLKKIVNRKIDDCARKLMECNSMEADSLESTAAEVNGR